MGPFSRKNCDTSLKVGTVPGGLTRILSHQGVLLPRIPAENARRLGDIDQPVDLAEVGFTGRGKDLQVRRRALCECILPVPGDYPKVVDRDPGFLHQRAKVTFHAGHLVRVLHGSDEGQGPAPVNFAACRRSAVPGRNSPAAFRVPSRCSPVPARD